MINEDGKPELRLQILDLLEDVALYHDIEGSRGLVHNQHFRVERQSHGDNSALAHTARKLVRKASQPPRLDTDQLEQLGRAGTGLAV